LATVVEGFHRGHRYQIVADAVACDRIEVGDAAAYRMAMLRAAGNFAGLAESRDLAASAITA
jgi:hypothetical protein